MSYTPSYKGVGAMLRSAGMQAAMRARAERVAAYARAIAPFDPDDRDGDHYRDHFTVSSGVQRRKTTRAFGKVTNDHPAAVSIEFGTGNPDGSRTPAHHTMLAALDGAKET